MNTNNFCFEEIFYAMKKIAVTFNSNSLEIKASIEMIPELWV